ATPRPGEVAAPSVLMVRRSGGRLFSLAERLSEAGKSSCKVVAAGEREPTLLHRKVVLLGDRIGRLIRAAPAILGGPITFANFVAEVLKHGRALPRAGARPVSLLPTPSFGCCGR